MEEKRKRFEGKKLKRKVVYVYESDSDQEGAHPEEEHHENLSKLDEVKVLA